VMQTRTAVMAYSAGLIGLLAVKILAPGFYGKQDIRTPVKIAIVILCCTQLFNLVLVPWLAHAGLALAIGLGACLNALALFVGLRRRGIYQPGTGWLAFFTKQIFALLCMAVPLWFAAQRIDWLALQSTPVIRIGLLAAVLGVSALVYLLALALLGIRPSHFRRAPT
jgi:putative peptidoglycan lipid II flippase